MNIRLYDSVNARITKIQRLMEERNPRQRRRTKAELVAQCIEAGLAIYQDNLHTLPSMTPEPGVWVRVILSDQVKNKVRLAFHITPEQAYNALAKAGAEVIVKDLKGKGIPGVLPYE